MIMPYIGNQLDRKTLNKIIEDYKYLLTSKGRLNYFIYKLGKESCHDYEDWRAYYGELFLCMLEIYRRQVLKCEDDAISRNGDVE